MALEDILPRATDKGSIHLRLAQLYDEVQQPDIAQNHRLRAGAQGN